MIESETKPVYLTDAKWEEDGIVDEEVEKGDEEDPEDDEKSDEESDDDDLVEEEGSDNY